MLQEEREFIKLGKTSDVFQEEEKETGFKKIGTAKQVFKPEPKEFGLPYIAKETMRGVTEDIRGVGKQIAGLGEGALSVASGLASFIPSVAGSLVGLVGSGLGINTPKEAGKLGHTIAKLGTYEPRTEEGKVIAQGLNTPFALLGKGLDWLAKEGAPENEDTQEILKIAAATALIVGGGLTGKAKLKWETTIKPKVAEILAKTKAGKRFKAEELKAAESAIREVNNELIRKGAEKPIEPLIKEHVVPIEPRTGVAPTEMPGQKVLELKKKLGREELIKEPIKPKSKIEYDVERTKATTTIDSQPKIDKSYTEQVVEKSRELSEKYKDVLKDKPELIEMHSGVSIKEALDGLGVPTESLRRDFKDMADYMRSPNRVLAKTEPGRKLYTRLADSDLAKGAWENREITQYLEATKNLKKDSVVDTSVFKVRDNQLKMNDVLKMETEKAAEYGITVEELSALKANKGTALKLDKFYDIKFDYLLRRYGKITVGKKGEVKIWNAVNRGEKDIMKAVGRKKKPPTESEKAIFDLYQKKISDYIPHIFDRKEMLEFLKQELRILEKKKATSKPSEWDALDTEGKEIVSSIGRIEGGEPILYDVLPQSVRFKFFEKRTGAKGYGISSMRAYETYLRGIARKMYDEPAIKEAIGHYSSLPNELKPYAKWYMQDYMGYYNHPFQTLTSSVRSLQWMMKLGLNPRSAIVNLTQRMNTIGSAGFKASTEGYANAVRNIDNIKQKFIDSGLPEEVHQVMAPERATQYAPGLEKVRNVAGWLFHKVERGNRLHSFSTGYFKAKKKGLPEKASIKAGKKLVHEAQFSYGRVDMPRALRGPGGVAFQFWSFPIKQIEFISKLARENPAGLVRWFVLAEGGKESLKHFLNLDLSSALGLGIDYAHLFKSLAALTQGDIKRFEINLKQSELPLVGGSGGGLMPYGPGPAIDAGKDFLEYLKGDMTLKEFRQTQLEPIVVQRGKQVVKAIAEGPNNDGTYNIRNPSTGELRYRETMTELVSRIAIASPAKSAKESKEVYKQRLIKKAYMKTVKQIADLMVTGKAEKAADIMVKNGIKLSDSSFESALLRRELTAKQRMELERATSKAMKPFEEKMRK